MVAGVATPALVEALAMFRDAMKHVNQHDMPNDNIMRQAQEQEQAKPTRCHRWPRHPRTHWPLAGSETMTSTPQLAHARGVSHEETDNNVIPFPSNSHAHSE